MDNEVRRGHKEALPYFLGGLVLLVVSGGVEIATSLAYPLVHTLFLLGGSYSVCNGALYFFGRNDDQNGS